MAKRKTERQNKFSKQAAFSKQDTDPKQNSIANFKKIKITAITEEQIKVLKAINDNQITIIYGPAGTGKTHLATLYGLKEFLLGTFDKLIFTRPCVEAYGEKLGMLPGDAEDKIAPYMIPIFDTISEYISMKELSVLVDNGAIRTLPLAFQRGVTFKNSFVVADEFQNTLPQQMRLFLTRIGKNTKVVITGDITQSDIEGVNGLSDAINRLNGINGLAIIQLSASSIVRNPIIFDIEAKYNTI
jgi:phosphate starvation-inducible PhoH-like protein